MIDKCYLRECWGHQVACSKCIVERFCSIDCLGIAQKSYHSFDCGGGTVDKGVATQSAAFLEKMLTDVSRTFDCLRLLFGWFKARMKQI